MHKAFDGVEVETGPDPQWTVIWLHGLGADRLRELYPRFDDFARVRGEADPQRLFGNDYLTRVLGD